MSISGFQFLTKFSPKTKWCLSLQKLTKFSPKPMVSKRTVVNTALNEIFKILRNCWANWVMTLLQSVEHIIPLLKNVNSCSIALGFPVQSTITSNPQSSFPSRFASLYWLTKCSGCTALTPRPNAQATLRRRSDNSVTTKSRKPLKWNSDNQSKPMIPTK